MRRVLRISFKLGLIAAIGIGIAVVVKKLTAPPADSAAPLEPWPPLSTETTVGTEAVEPAEAGTATEGPGNGSEPAGEAAVEEPAPSTN